MFENEKFLSALDLYSQASEYFLQALKSARATVKRNEVTQFREDATKIGATPFLNSNLDSVEVLISEGDQAFQEKNYDDALVFYSNAFKILLHGTKNASEGSLESEQTVGQN